MRAVRRCILILWALLCLALPAGADTRALLVACSDFQSHPDLGSAISGNLHMIGSALLGADPPLSGLTIEDGTIGTASALESAIHSAFGDADEDDLSILYLCTHGVLSSSDDEQVYLLLGDGRTESALSAAELCRQLGSIQGEKLLILDACFSGALIGRGVPQGILLPGVRQTPGVIVSPFLSDLSIHVLTSASGSESSWYYDSASLQTGAVSYFASALSSGLGLYGRAEADMNGDGSVSLKELSRHLRASVPSSSCQLLSGGAQDVLLPTAQGAMLSRPLSSFSFGDSLLPADDPTLEFSFTVTDETAVQYRLIEYENGAWNWAEAITFLDEGEEDGYLSKGRHSRMLTLPTVAHDDSGYLMLQVFSVSGGDLLLCSERLLAVQPVIAAPKLTIRAPQTFDAPQPCELPIQVSLGAPAEITVTIFDAQGQLVTRLAAAEMTRPGEESTLSVYWNGTDDQGQPVKDGMYTVAAETTVGFSRVKATAGILVSRGI